MTAKLYFRDGSIADPEVWKKKQGDAEYVQVVKTTLPGGARWVSTLWTGIDDGTLPSPDGRPLIFETVVFDHAKRVGLDRARWADEESARAGHEEMVRRWSQLI